MFHVPASVSQRRAAEVCTKPDAAIDGMNSSADRREAALHCHLALRVRPRGRRDATWRGRSPRRCRWAACRCDRGIAGDTTSGVPGGRSTARARSSTRAIALVARHGDLDAHRGGAGLAAGPVDARRRAGIHLRSGDVEQRERRDRILFARGHRLLRTGQPQPRGARRRGGEVAGPLGVEPGGDRGVARGAQPLHRGVIEEHLAGADAGRKRVNGSVTGGKPGNRDAELAAG